MTRTCTEGRNRGKQVRGYGHGHAGASGCPSRAARCSAAQAPSEVAVPSRPRHPHPAAHQAVFAMDAPRRMTPPVTAPARTAVVALPAEPASVSLARRWATDLLTQWGVSADDLDTTALVIGELAANTVRYGHREMTIRLLQQEHWLYLCVTDSGAPLATPRLVIPQELAEHGRGLAIVEAQAETIEVTREPEGWRVGVVLPVTTAGNPVTQSAAGVA
ncbi:ATP-binding protein [Streptomyces sp. NPDC058964]|uniref:ATP-binding protein n=1 Tax=Streptomyces sp. NPDC058964 TaxID=3346681 RepID=UPI0036B03337